MAGRKRIGVAVIASGRAGMIHARNFATGRVAGAELVSICDPVDAALRKACQELGMECGVSDYREIVSDLAVDAVVVATPSAYHCEIAVAAARTGKHILCEKPMAGPKARSGTRSRRMCWGFRW